MASAFSTRAEEAFTRIIEIKQEGEIKDNEINKFFETERSISFLVRNGYKKVALQFPDDHLKDSFKIVKLLQEKVPDLKLYILGDTTYGSCCVDEIAAEHVKADCIIHFGRACMSKTRRLPVLFIFGKRHFDVEEFCQNFKKTFDASSNQIILFYDVTYEHAIGKIHESLKDEYENLIVSKLMTDENIEKCRKCCEQKFQNKKNERGSMVECCKTDNNIDGDNCSCLKEVDVSKLYLNEECLCKKDELQNEQVYERFGRKFMLQSESHLEDFNILYIGKQSLTLTNLMMSYNRNKFYTYDPHRHFIQQETLNINKALMKRYYLMQKAKEAKTVGIVAGTLGVADYMVIIEQLKKLLKQSGKKYYTFMMGKPNVAKMANFMEIDVFVLVACPENSLIDSQEFYRPIVTPFEMEIACSRGRNWTGEYITDFRELLPGAASFIDFEMKEDINEEEEPEYSLVTGNLISRNETEPERATDVGSYKDIILKNQENAVATFGENSSAYHLNTRSWKGLEKKLGETEVADAIDGRTGIAMGYTHETIPDAS